MHLGSQLPTLGPHSCQHTPYTPKGRWQGRGRADTIWAGVGGRVLGQAGVGTGHPSIPYTSISFRAMTLWCCSLMHIRLLAPSSGHLVHATALSSVKALKCSCTSPKCSAPTELRCETPLRWCRGEGRYQRSRVLVARPADEHPTGCTGRAPQQFAHLAASAGQPPSPPPTCTHTHGHRSVETSSYIGL